MYYFNSIITIIIRPNSTITNTIRRTTTMTITFTVKPMVLFNRTVTILAGDLLLIVLLVLILSDLLVLHITITVKAYYNSTVTI